jgi:predicted Zn-dependent peptidase
MDDVRQFYTDQYHAGGSVLAVAGNFDANQIFDSIEQSFGDWKSGKRPALPSPAPIDGNEHIELPSSQTHIGFSFDSIPYGSDDYFVMRAGIGILSDGMSSRLFDRVREQRGLCYSVWASTHTIGQHGAVFGYAGTTPARAQETLDVSLREIQHLADDLEQEELSRWKVRIESGLIMEQESAGSRASSLASDQYQLGRVIPTEELEAKIEAITLDQVASYFRQHGPRQFRIVTVGPEALQGGETLA